MDVDRMRRVEAVLDAALTSDPTDWPALLDERCSGDPELRREVEALLGRLDTAEGFLESPPGAVAAALVAEERESAGWSGAGALEGRRVGAWRIVRELGRGGMSRVFLAERADGQFEQRVALKLLRPGLDSELDRERFRAERQILATLSHPGIARLLDGGMTDEGVPYLVMEHVDGVPLDRYCAEHDPPLAERLRLFRAVAEATHFAHRNLVVHRDLKPSNILVTADGTVKLLDFGIAKLLQPGPDSAAATRTGHRWMTPQYAAPEQVRGDAVGTLTDVYQLGVVLYELLAGRLPFADRAGSLFELERAILEEEPPPPSAAATREAPARARALRGDLDAIVMKAMHKEPERRYATAAELLDDVDRFRGGYAVRARPDGAGYRLRKFARRNRAAVAAAAVTIAALVGATAFSVAQAAEARRQRDTAREQSRRQFAMSELQSVIATDTRGPGGRALTMLERLELAERMLVRRFPGERKLVADVLVNLATRLYEIGERQAERAMLARAVLLARDAGAPSTVAQAECERVYSFVFDDQYDSARASLAVAHAELARSGAGAGTAARAVCLRSEGALLAATGVPDSAISLLGRAVALADTAQEGGPVLGYLNDLSNALRGAGRTREATDYQRRIVRQLDSTGFLGTDLFANGLSHLAAGLWELGELRVVDSIVGSSVRALEAVNGTGDPGAVIEFIYGLGKLRLGALDSAEVWMARAMTDSTEGGGGIQVWWPSAFAQLRIEQGRVGEAESAFQALPGGTFGRGVTASWLRAWRRRALGDSRGASRELDSALAAQLGDRPKPPPVMAVPFATAAEWHLADGDARGADSLARLAMTAAAVDSLALERSAWAGRAELVRARALRSLGDEAGARRAAERAAVALANGAGASNPRALAARAFADSLRR